MTHIRITSVGSGSAWEKMAMEDYLRRLIWKVSVDCLPSSPMLSRNIWQRSMAKPGVHVVWHQDGRMLDSQTFARKLAAWLHHAPVCFYIGAAYGFEDLEDALREADHVLSMGPMTFPHGVARLLVLEQVYRAFSILRGHGYHHN